MPVGVRKNQLYAALLPLIGRRCHWRTAAKSGDTPDDISLQITRVFKHNHVVGGCVQRIRNGLPAECYYAGNASLSPKTAVDQNTIFRTASIAKTACAMLVMRLQTLGKLDVTEDISSFWPHPLRNPHHPEIPIPLSALLSHTSGLIDSPRYYQSFTQSLTVDEIWSDAGCFSTRLPFAKFQYSNFAAGLIGCLLEYRFGESLESLIQRKLFAPLGVDATFDLATLAHKQVANSYRIIPSSPVPAFNAPARMHNAASLQTADPQRHYLLASGSLFLTTKDLASLLIPLMQNGKYQGKPFLSPDSLLQMQTPLSAWPDNTISMRHGMGLFTLEHPSLYPGKLYGHQGIAYGAVNGLFFNEDGDGFVSLNSGASELRQGHLSCLNRDLIRICIARHDNA